MEIVDRLVEQGLTEELAKKVADNFGKVIDGIYMPKTRFDDVNAKLKTANETIAERDKQIDTIGKSSKDIETLKEDIKNLKKANEDATKQAELTLLAERKNNAIKMELNGKVHNVDMTMGQFKLDEIIMNEDGTVKAGLKEQLAEVQKSNPFLFIPENNTNEINPANIKGATPKSGDNTGVEGQPKLSVAEMFAKNLAQSKKETSNSNAMNYYFGENK